MILLSGGEEGERNADHIDRLPPASPLEGTEPITQAGALTSERDPQALTAWDTLKQLSHSSQS